MNKSKNVMQYSPKLKRVMEEIKNILNREDIAGCVVLHTPGHCEYVLKIDPSYSCAKILPNGGGIKVNSKEIKNTRKKKRAIADTSNMLNLLGEVTGLNAVRLIEISELVDKQSNATHFGSGHSSHESQNN